MFAFAAVALAVPAASERSERTRDWVRYQVAPGRTRVVSLADGLTVYLNTNTDIGVRNLPKETIVAVAAGEVLIEGIGNRRVTVLANGSIIHSTGAARFSIRVRDADRIDALVASGSAYLGRTERRLPGWLLAAVPFVPEGTPLAAGEAASQDSQGIYARKALPAIAVTHKLAWKDGWLWFGNEPLPDAVERFNAYNTRQIVLDDRRLYRLDVGGRFHPTQPECFVASLQYVFGVCVVHTDGSNTIHLRAGCAPTLRRCDTAMVQ
ncbi:MAG TPA: hypothetical protein VGM84_11200 [Steroidobacteraceae bacterium]